LYGLVQEIPQKETTPFYPRSPYGVAKLYGYWITVNYREAYNMFAINGILFNHESPIRGEGFVTRKIVIEACRVLNKKSDCIYLGNLNAKRDWGHAKDYIEGMWLMMQQEKPEDYVLATGKTTTVREFVFKVFQRLGVELVFEGEGEDEKGVVKSSNNSNIENGQIVVSVHPRYYRPTEVDILIGDATKAFNNLGWKPKYDLDGLIDEMVNEEIKKYS
jgi:GDPmannose 4,6-dehydratase